VTESANVKLVRSIHAAWERGDFSSVEWAHPEIEWAAPDGPEPSRGTGTAAMTKAWGDFLSAWGDYRAVAEEYRELDDERVLVLLEATARGKASGLEIGQMLKRSATLFHVRDGAVTRLDIYWDREHALADLGLAPESETS
jgi:ketosteroid isomerase-like protein